MCVAWSNQTAKSNEYHSLMWYALTRYGHRTSLGSGAGHSMTICTWLRAVYISLNFFLYSAMAALELAGIVHGLTRGMVKGLTLQSWQNSFSVCRILLPCHAFMGRACLPNSAQVSDSAICPTCQGRMWSKGVFFLTVLTYLLLTYSTGYMSKKWLDLLVQERLFPRNLLVCVAINKTTWVSTLCPQLYMS